MSVHSYVMFIIGLLLLTGALKTQLVVNLAYILSSSLNYMLWP